MKRLTSMIVSGKKVAIIGAGHNGLVAGAYLARAGFDVSIFEQKGITGGMCVTEELIPGFKFSSLASWSGMLRKKIIEDLELEKYGLVIDTSLDNLRIFPDGDYIHFPVDGDPFFSLKGTTPSDFKDWEILQKDLALASEVLKPFLIEEPVSKETIERVLEGQGLGKVAQGIFKKPLIEFVREYISNEKLIGAACTGTLNVLPQQIGTVFQRLYLGTSETNGIKGKSGLPKGGLGAISDALARSAEAAGVKIFCNSRIKNIMIRDNTACGLIFEDGSIKELDLILSSTDPYTTFLKLIPAEEMPNGFRDKIHEKKEVSLRSTSCKVHIALSALPELAIPVKTVFHSVTIQPLISKFEELFKDAKEGNFPDDNIVTLNIPSISDPSLAPFGKHCMTISLYCIPYFNDGKVWDDVGRKKIFNHTLKILERSMPNISTIVENWKVIAPTDLESSYGVSTYSCYHLPSTPEFLFEERPLRECSHYETPIRNLFLCGSGSHPGGSVSGIPGHNAAQKIIRGYKAFN